MKKRRGLFGRMLNVGILGGGGTYAAKVLGIQTANLLAYWTCSDAAGSTAAVDATGHGYNGTPVGAGVAFGQPGVTGKAKTSASLDGSTVGIEVYSAGLASAFNNQELTLAIWAWMGTALWTDGANRGIYILRADVNNRVYITKTSTNNTFSGAYAAGGTSKSITSVQTASTSWFHFALTVSKAADQLRFFINGAQIGDPVTGLGSWSGALADNVCYIGSYAGLGLLTGGIQHAALWSKALTPAEVASLASPFSGGSVIRYLHAVGDSKTAATPGYPDATCNSLRSASGLTRVYQESRVGVGGITTQGMADRVAADIAAMAYTPDEILINLGANDANEVPDKDTWKASMAAVIGPYNTAFPAANIRIAKIWKRNTGVQAQAIAVMNTAIDELYAANAYLKPAINEADILEGGDDGATYTSDGVHPTAAGYILEGMAWAALIGQ